MARGPSCWPGPSPTPTPPVSWAGWSRPIPRWCGCIGTEPVHDESVVTPRPCAARAMTIRRAAGARDDPPTASDCPAKPAAWAEARDPDLAMGWRLLAATGMRRGEALALRWRDVDLDAGRLQVRRSLSTVKTKGAGEQLVEGPTKTGQARVVDIDADTIAALRAYRAVRGSLTLDLVRDTAPVLGNLDGTPRHPERYSRRFVDQVAQARRALGEDQLPRIRLHDLRHTHATLLLAAGEPVKVVSERLGHANAMITLTVYQHVHPGMGRQAADRFAALLRG